MPAVLRRSADRKVATNVRITKNSVAKSLNSFGLPSGKAYSCPGATSVCEKICYAGKLEKIYKGVVAIVVANYNALIATDRAGMVSLLSDMINEYRAECDKKNNEKKFRIHWDGDFFSRDYASAWAEVIIANPDIHFWVYTRSFVPALNVIDLIAGISNLSVYLSVDDDNFVHAGPLLIAFPDVKVASLAKTASDAKEMFPTRRTVSCPENVGKRLPLVVPNRNDSSNGVGACIACGVCVDSRKDVAFAISGKEN
jgi:hypothetical protein